MFLLQALQQGRVFHDCIIGSGSEFDVSVGIALIDMHTRCGVTEFANQLFNDPCKRVKDMVPWSAVIAENGMHGCGVAH